MKILRKVITWTAPNKEPRIRLLQQGVDVGDIKLSELYEGMQRAPFRDVLFITMALTALTTSTSFA